MAHVVFQLVCEIIQIIGHIVKLRKTVDYFCRRYLKRKLKDQVLPDLN
jgi:hypothetical protein